MTYSSELLPEESNKESFLQQLPDLLASANQTWYKISQGIWSDASLNQLYELITDITSLSGLHDFTSLHQHSLAIQDYLKLFIHKNTEPSSNQITEINALFDELETALQETIRHFEDHPISSKIQLLFVTQTDSISSNLQPLLQEKNFSVRTVSSIDQAQTALDEHTPAGIVIETSELPFIESLQQVLESIKKTRLVEIPVFLISNIDDTQMRLAAMRSGIDRYFSIPHDASQILGEIELLCRPEKFKPYKVLIIEDDPTQAEFAASILTRAGMETDIASDPMEVMERLKGFIPDAILMDIYMPDANGLELTTIIRDDLRYMSTPIIFLSGEIDQDKQISALLLGGDDFISKPIRPKLLIATVKNRIKRTRDLIHAIEMQYAPSSPIAEATIEIQPITNADENLVENDETELDSEFIETAPTNINDVLEEKLRLALASGKLKSFYQPILCIKGTSSENYSLITKLPDQEGFIEWQELVSATQDRQLLHGMDLLAVQHALNSIVTFNKEDKKGTIFVQQTLNDIRQKQSPDWIKDLLRAKHMVGTSLVLEFRFSNLVPLIKETRDYFGSLKEMGIKICLTDFPAKKAAFKILHFLGADYIKVSRKLLKTESSVINTYVNQAHKLSTQVIVTNISDPRETNLHWTTLADYIQGNFISPASESMNFNFSQSAL